jgi:hypothetical protein
VEGFVEVKISQDPAKSPCLWIFLWFAPFPLRGAWTYKLTKRISKFEYKIAEDPILTGCVRFGFFLK